MSEETPPKPKKPDVIPFEEPSVYKTANFSGTNINSVKDEIRDWSDEVEQTRGSKMYGVKE